MENIVNNNDEYRLNSKKHYKWNSLLLRCHGISLFNIYDLSQYRMILKGKNLNYLLDKLNKKKT